MLKTDRNVKRNRNEICIKMRVAANIEKKANKSLALTREAILNAAQNRIAIHGPEGLKIMDVAKDAGISHPLVLHHFGSKAGLIDALISRLIISIAAELEPLFMASFSGGTALDSVVNAGYEFWHVDKRAELLFWAYSKQPDRIITIIGENLIKVIDVANKSRMALMPSGTEEERLWRDSARTFLLVTFMLVGDGLFGELMTKSVGLDVNDRHKIRTMMAKMVIRRLMGS